MENKIIKNILMTLGIILFLGTGIYAGYMALRSGTNSGNIPLDSQYSATKKIIGDPDPKEDIVMTQLTAEQKINCSTITPQVTSGPFYISNVPDLVDDNLNFTNLQGSNMSVSGKVFGGMDNSIPLSNVKIEIWQADNEGKYRPESNGDYNSINQSLIALRGTIYTDENGDYSYTSIFPAEYEGRTRHAHYRITKEGYNGLTTQLTFFKDGDKFPAEKDNVASQLLNCQNIKNLLPVDGVYKSTFDFRLGKD